MKITDCAGYSQRLNDLGFYVLLKATVPTNQIICLKERSLELWDCTQVTASTRINRLARKGAISLKQHHGIGVEILSFNLELP